MRSPRGAQGEPDAELRVRDGKIVEVADFAFSPSGDLHENIQRTLIVEAAVTLTVYGRVSGTVTIRSDATLIACSDVCGTVHVGPSAAATFHRSRAGH